MFLVMAAAVSRFTRAQSHGLISVAYQDELLLDRLVLICSVVILKCLDVNNACYILTDASHFHASELVNSIQGYLAANLETFLESRMLDDLTPALIDQLSHFIRGQQAEKMPTPRNNILGKLALEKHAEWLALQDFPETIIRSNRQALRKQSLKQLSPAPVQSKRPQRVSLTNSPLESPVISERQPSQPNDDIFAMDDADPVTPMNLDGPSQSVPSRPGSYTVPVWKASSTPRFVTCSSGTELRSNALLLCLVST